MSRSVRLSNLTGASRKTLKQHFRSLIELGYLHQRGSGPVCGMTCVNLINLGY
ncbi:hypothetical protein [Nitrosomonas sp.]|uniref:hypothetical protein n=1 Tax=Nitrosomonas sp. TaxID=42353 RepID=UPI00374D4E59